MKKTNYKKDLDIIKKALDEIQGGLYPQEKEALQRIESKLDLFYNLINDRIEYKAIKYWVPKRIVCITVKKKFYLTEDEYETIYEEW